MVAVKKCTLLLKVFTDTNVIEKVHHENVCTRRMQHFKDTIYHGFLGIKHKADRTYRMTSEREHCFLSGNKNQINIDRAICTRCTAVHKEKD